MKFCVGDIVRGIKGSSNSYRITNEHSICEVVQIDKREDTTSPFQYNLRLRVLDHETLPEFIGEDYWANSHHFELESQLSVKGQDESQFLEMLGL